MVLANADHRQSPSAQHPLFKEYIYVLKVRDREGKGGEERGGEGRGGGGEGTGGEGRGGEGRGIGWRMK